ncbi:SCO3242 family prenyltransferase [Isoptericola sp. b408]|uniref:SCO3242 family prenyltransferase n=1 Tax=Isoptericola sp. b408 TaxID=3064653 RepID=UPI0027125BFA|nr:UbiA family prenyltransferase [Isoptericola sp. b408]MDO8150908.1 UbiA family prenyltransferase [Isoptericola sp. b408]
MRAGDLVELVRAPAALTVLGDTLAGMATARPPDLRPPRHALLPVASTCLYLGGMALNDYGDRDLDAVERPERPIPSGRVTPRQALAVGTGLVATGVAAAGAASGRRGLAVAVPLAACVLTYDLAAKDRPAGAVVMAACRGLDVLLGAAPGSLRTALPTAAVLTTHTLAVTALSRGEVHGTTRGVAGSAVAGTVAVAATTAVAAWRAPAGSPGGPTVRRVAALAATAGYVATCLPAQRTAAADRTAPAARTATRAGLQAMIPLQAAWTARGGRWASTAVLAGAVAAGRLLRRGRRQVSIT